MKLSEALDKYIAFGQFKNKASSMDTYKTHIRHLCVHFKNCEIENVTLDGVIEYLNLMKEVGWDRNAFVAKCSAWKQFFGFFRKQGYKVLDHELIPIPEIEYKFPKILEEADYKKLLKVAETYRGIHGLRDRAILRMLWDTGVRLNEFRSMKWADMDLVNMRTVIKTEKSRGVRPVRMVFWTKETNKLLKEYIELRNAYILEKKCPDEGWLWISAHNRWHEANQMSESSVGLMLKNLSYKANLGYICNPHRFRHAYGRNLAFKGANNSVISDMMGHTNINNTRIYTVMNEGLMQETYDKFVKHR